MTREDLIRKWFAYATALCLTAGLQALVFSRLRPLGVTPVLLPLAMTALAALEGPVSGAGFGIAVGALSVCLDGSSPWSVILFCLGGLVTGLVSKYALRSSFLGFAVCSLGASAVFTAAHILPRWLGGKAALPVLLRVGGPELLWTMLLSPIVYFLFRFVFRRWGSAYYL